MSPLIITLLIGAILITGFLTITLPIWLSLEENPENKAIKTILAPAGWLCDKLKLTR